MADAATRSASAMAHELLGFDVPAAGRGQPTFARSGPSAEPVVSPASPSGEDAFRSAYRLTDEGLVMLDQRGIPDALDEVVARRGSDVAYYLRLGVARGGPLLAQLAAYGLALTAAERADLPADQREAELQRTARALVESGPTTRLLAWAVERMRAASGGMPADSTGAEVAERLRAEADAIAGEVAVWQAAIAAGIAGVLPEPQPRPLAVLLHGSQGALAGGLVGSGIAALARLRDEGRRLRLLVTEGRPFMDGARLTSWELRQAGLDHRVIADSAVAWLLDHEPVDVVLLSAEWVAANGDVGALIGSRTIAALVGTAPAPRPLLLVSAPQATRDPETPDGAAIPAELRPARDLTAYLRGVPIRTSDALVPAADVIPASSVDVLVTEAGPGPRATTG